VETLLSAAGVVVSIVGAAWYLASRMKDVEHAVDHCRLEVSSLCNEMFRVSGRITRLEQKGAGKRKTGTR